MQSHDSHSLHLLVHKVMYGYARVGNVERVEELLQLLHNEFDRGERWATPNAKHYTTLCLAWQKSMVPESPERCEEILRKMHHLADEGGLPECKPDTKTYTSILHSWSDSGRDDAPERAEALFRKMKQRYESGDTNLQPDTIVYSNLINALSKSEGFTRAEDILWEMVDDYLNGNTLCKPRIRNLNTIVAVWSKSSAPHAAIRAENVVRRWLHAMETTKLDVPPDNYTYCLLLKCW